MPEDTEYNNFPWFNAWKNYPKTTSPDNYQYTFKIIKQKYRKPDVL